MMLLLYTPEMYPTRMRALGCSLATSWIRIAGAASPIVLAGLVSVYSIGTVFAIMGIAPLVGAVVTLVLAIETKGKVLEQLAP